MALWLTLLLGVALPVAALVAAAFYVYRRRRLPRNAPPELPIGAAGASAAASPGLEKLNAKYNASSGRVGVRFQQLHHHHHGRVHAKHRAPAQKQGPFQWGDHPRLVIEAAENGWAQFVFAVAPPRARSATSSPMWGLCPVCDAGTSGELADAAWDVPVGSSERMQAVRLNPATASASAAASSKKWLPGSVTSPLRSDQGLTNSGNTLCVAKMSMPLPGPPMAGTPFSQDAYFEITIIYLNTRRPEWSTSRASTRGKDGSVETESDRIKLIDFAPETNNAIKETTAAKDDHGDKQRHLVMSLGLAAGSATPPRPSLAGTYASSIGFHTNGAVYLDVG
ncbi:unnamed protein product [Alopecurus aequalis]